RFDTLLDEPEGNRWKDRVHSAIEAVRRYDPHVVGFQEALASRRSFTMLDGSIARRRATSG
ncbi:MAG: hypothetical protein ACRDTT_31525, partial [Pseudonocardiaceae bacterium]